MELAPLDNREVARLTRCERVIEKGLCTFREVGQALLQIKEEALYRAEYTTFAEYCQVKWKFNDARARQLIAAAKTAETVEISTPLKESHAKELSRVPEDERQEVLDAAVEASGDKPLTARAIREAAEEVLSDDPVEDDDEPEATGKESLHVEPEPKDDDNGNRNQWLLEAADELREACGNRELVAGFLDGLAEYVRETTTAVAAAALENTASKVRRM